MGERSDIAVDQDQSLAFAVLKSLADVVGDHETMQLDLERIHRILLFMRGMMLEADQALRTKEDFSKSAYNLAVLVADEAWNARLFRQRNGIGLIELALKSDNCLN